MTTILAYDLGGTRMKIGVVREGRVVLSELGDAAALVAGEWLLQEQSQNL